MGMTRTRAEHMAWCKERALGELDFSGPVDCLASMASDLGKHPETAGLVDFCVLAGMLHAGDARSARTFIEGFA